MTIRELTIAQESLSLVDPHDCTDSRAARSVHEALFDALVRRDRQLRYVPGIATSWQVADDARTWTFQLREGVRFHNGDPCDAEAVCYSIERMARPDVGATLGAPAVYAQYLAGVEVRMIDARTVRVELSQPTADLLDILVDGYVLPPRVVEALGDGFRAAPVGTGPYRFAGWEPGARIVAEANAGYFAGAPRFAQVTWQRQPELDTRLAALRAGQADIVVGLDSAARRAVEAEGRFPVVDARGTTCVVYLLNCFNGPFADRLVRRAASHAIDQRALTDAAAGGAGYPLASFCGAHHLGYDPAVAPCPHDPHLARQLLADAGYRGGLSVDLLSPTSLPDEAPVLSRLLAEQLARVGIEARVTFVEDRVEYATMVRHKQIGDLCCFDSSPLSTFRVLREKLSSVQRGSWWQGYDSATLNALIERAARTVDDGERAAIYRRAYGLVHDDAPWLFLYDPRHTFATTEALRGWTPRADGTIVVQEV
jgi:peptide/nickel transport system substrate-binding protein